MNNLPTDLQDIILHMEREMRFSKCMRQIKKTIYQSTLTPLELFYRYDGCIRELYIYSFFFKLDINKYTNTTIYMRRHGNKTILTCNINPKFVFVMYTDEDGHFQCKYCYLSL